MESPEEKVERKRKYWKRAKWCNLTGVVLGVLIVAPIGIALFDRREPIDFEKGRMLPRNVRPGEVVEVTWYATRKRNCEGEFSRRVIDAAGKINDFIVELPIYPPTGRHDGNPETFTRVFQLPAGMVPGPAYYTPRGVHWCNVIQKWLWPIAFDAPWIPFNVLPPLSAPYYELPPNAVDPNDELTHEHPRVQQEKQSEDSIINRNRRLRR